MLGFLVVTAVAVVRLHDLFAAAMLFGIYSLVSAGLFVVLDAVDVAFTEAAVGTGISTILMLGTLSITGSQHEITHSKPILALIVVTITGCALIYATLDLPHVGDPQAPAHKHVAPLYIAETPSQVGVPNVVTAVLASYRGYDTLGEVTVIFT
ncbi:MAG: DUF4040 domain-containing protein, partial [Gammaproteobacteria bacterium]|nr:DUF4040 domain-containing protein [Gammaproteobacteria bacterium]